METKLWSDKHKPLKAGDIVAQHKAMDETMEWLQHWKKGKALLFAGPTGVGKSMLPEIIAGEKGFELLQLNASDKRNAEQIDSFAGSTKTISLFSKGKIILLDEVDGISGQDRGAVASIIKLIKESDFPVILAASDPYLPKLRPLRPYTEIVKFSRIPSPSIAKRLGEICRKEGINADPEALKNLARWSQGDMRSALTDLQMICRGKKEITIKDLEVLGFRERGNQIFDILPTIFSSGNITASRKAIMESDKDADEVFQWVASNIQYAYREPEEIAQAYEILSRADVFRGLVRKQQNWAFKGYMVDMLSGISLASKKEHHGWIQYQPPQKLMLLGRTKAGRALRNSACQKIGRHAHCSAKKVKEPASPI